MTRVIVSIKSLSCWVVIIGIMLFLSGCARMASPESFFELSSTYSKDKALQSRFFETSNQRELISASAAVLQDLGFQVEESESHVGVLRAVKERSAREWGQEIARTFVALIGAMGGKVILLPVDLHQQIAATLTVFPAENDSKKFCSRIIFHRKVWKGDGSDGSSHIPPGEQRLEMINDPVIYQQFFSKLSKSVFLEAHQI